MPLFDEPSPFKKRETPEGHKKSVSLRIDQDVLQYFKDHGKGYQTLINDVLRKHMERERSLPQVYEFVDIATALATAMKATGDDDAGNFWNDDDHGHLNQTQWNLVSGMAAALMPMITVSTSTLAEWRRADRAYAADQRAERLAFNGE